MAKSGLPAHIYLSESPGARTSSGMRASDWKRDEGYYDVCDGVMPVLPKGAALDGGIIRGESGVSIAGHQENRRERVS